MTIDRHKRARNVRRNFYGCPPGTILQVESRTIALADVHGSIEQGRSETEDFQKALCVPVIQLARRLFVEIKFDSIANGPA
jgi:hypothetical protein